MTLNERLIKIQTELKAPKSQFNSFGKYSYRNCEDILEAVKPLLAKYECLLTISDNVLDRGNRIYVHALATIKHGEETINASAFAREPEDKKGMDCSQITGAASSYARKYALNGLFLIDDSKDADFSNNHQTEKKPLTQKQISIADQMAKLESIDSLSELWLKLSADDKLALTNAKDVAKKRLANGN